MGNKPRGTTVLFALFLILPSTVDWSGRETATPANSTPALAPLLGAVAATVRPFDQGAFDRDIAQAYQDAPEPADPHANSGVEYSPPSGTTTWINNTTITMSSLLVQGGATLIVQRSTILVDAPTTNPAYLTVLAGSAMTLTDSTIKPAPGASESYVLNMRGSFAATTSRLEGATGTLSPGTGDSLRIANSIFPGAPGQLSLVSTRARVESSLFYNYSRTTALVVTEGAAVLNSTFVHNDAGIELKGNNPAAKGNVLRFNRVGIQWTNAPGAVATGNDFIDNYQDGLFGSGQAGASLEANGNWWGGTPNVDGDTYGGNGVNVASSATSRVATRDRTSEVPFPLHAYKTSTTLNLATLDGPVMARAGTLTINGPILDAKHYRIGSHAGGLISAKNVEMKNLDYLYSRGNDVYDGLVIQQAGTGGFRIPGVAAGNGGLGVVVIAGTPTIQNSRFENLTTAVWQAPRMIDTPDTVVKVRILSTTFNNVGTAFAGAYASPDLQSVTIRNASTAFACSLCANSVVSGTLIENATVGIIDVLGQGLTISTSSAYGTSAGIILYGTSTPTITTFEARYNAIALVALGSQLTLANSQTYDNPLFGTYAAPIILNGVSVAGKISIDPTSYSADPAHGDVSFVPPKKASPSANPGRPSDQTPVLIATTSTIGAAYAAPGPIIVRPGGRLTIDQATVDMGRYLLGVMPGGSLTIKNSTVSRGFGIIAHTAVDIQDSTFQNARFANVVLVEDASNVRASVFKTATTGLVLWDSRATVDRSLFVADDNVGIVLVNDTVPPSSGPTIKQSFFLDGRPAIRGEGNPRATLRDNSFRSVVAMDAGQAALYGLVGTTTGPQLIDAKNVWWNSTLGPSTPSSSGNGAWIFWAVPSQPTVSYSPWLTAPWRAVFTASKTTVMTGESVTFTDNSYNTDNAITGRSWKFGDGATSTLKNPTHAWSTPGVFVVRENVTDAYGWVSPATATISVKAAPIASLWAPLSVASLTPVRLDGANSTDADGTVTQWRFQTSDGYDSGFKNFPNATRTFARSGTYQVNLTVKDNEGFASPTITRTIVVQNRLPAVFWNSTPNPTSPVATTKFTSTSTDLDGSVVDQAWNFGDGSAVARGSFVTHKYASLGNFTATLTVTDDQGGVASLSKTIRVVENAAPEPLFTYTPSSATTGQNVRFVDQSTDADDAVVGWAWDFGDGSTSTERNPVHVFTDAGPRVVTLTVTDARGENASFSRVLVLQDALRFDFSIEPRAPGITDDVVLRVRAHWDNGTAAPGRMTIRVIYNAPLLPSTNTIQWGSYSVVTDADGVARVQIRPPQGDLTPPGVYNVAVSGVASKNWQGNEKAGAAAWSYEIGLV